MRTQYSQPSIRRYWQQAIPAASLAIFRIAFSFMMALSILRFWSKGWIEELYLKPSFFFSYYGFNWIKPLGDYTWLLFAVCFIAAVMVMLGWF
ncbi:MAG TPA: HTTM domain-containing protein, partial [Chitinophagaceae bacterium]|nr:HTTM domain-containing protein [Chitinophagaceae bacterium]